MKIKSLIPLSLTASAALLWAAEEPAPKSKPAMRDATRHEDIVARMRRAEDPMKNLPKAKDVPADKREAKPVDLLKRSDFLSLNGLSTLVPKGALLHVPEGYRSRLKFESGAKIVTWPEFFRRNRGWVTTLEVTREQAEGAKAFPETTLKALEKSPRVVVATLGGGPISVLPGKPAAKETTDGQTGENVPAKQSKTNLKP